MRKRDKDKLKKMLIEERAKIVNHLKKLASESSMEISDIKGDDLDIASVEISQAALSKLGSRERKLLKKIDYTLEKFEEGTYGVCELTGEDIPLARLMARPVAQYTIEAKTELEENEKKYRDPDQADEEDDWKSEAS